MDCTINKKMCEEFTIVISDEEDIKPKLDIKKATHNNAPKRKVSLSAKNGSKETLIITQKVKVKKQDVKCVINLNTTVYDNSGEIKQENTKAKPYTSSRNAPFCSRKKCRIRNSKEKERTYKPKEQKSKTYHCKCKNKSREGNGDHSKYSPKQKPCSEIKADSLLPKCPVKGKSLDHRTTSLSPISLSPIHSDISYEDISLDSFTSCQESELDSLIRRTKERDRRTSLSIKKLCCSTSKNVIEIASNEEQKDDKSFKYLNSQVDISDEKKTSLNSNFDKTNNNESKFHDEYSNTILKL